MCVCPSLRFLNDRKQFKKRKAIAYLFLDGCIIDFSLALPYDFQGQPISTPKVIQRRPGHSPRGGDGNRQRGWAAPGSGPDAHSTVPGPLCSEEPSGGPAVRVRTWAWRLPAVPGKVGVFQLPASPFIQWGF